MLVQHVVLGAGGIGGLLAALLARAGEEVTVVTRRSVAAGAATVDLTVRSGLFGDFSQPVERSGATPAGADVVWVAVKSTGLVPALELAPPERVGAAVVVPLLNGVDHVAVLRDRYRNVCAAAIRIESHRVAPGVIEQRSPFAHLTVALDDTTAAGRAVADALDILRVAGFRTSTGQDEATVLWDKLAFLAPIALSTAAWDLPLGGVRHEPLFVAAQREAVAAARVDGARTELDAVRVLTAGAPASLRSSMQLDVAAGREPELDAVAGAVLRRASGGAAPATQELAERVADRFARLAATPGQ